MGGNHRITPIAVLPLIQRDALAFIMQKTPNHGVLQLGNPLLRQGSALAQIPLRDPDLILIDQMMGTMQVSAGVGIAAPQLGCLVQIIMVGSRPTPRYPQAPTMERQAMINPQIIEASDVLVNDWEGCLSVPGIPWHGSP